MLLTKGKTDCAPADVGYDAKRLDVLNNHFQKLIDTNEIYCATYCLSRKGKIFASGGVGYKTYKKDPNLLVKPDDIHYIASMTKTFTGVAIMKLFEDGITNLDIKVGEILPQFNTPPFDAITIYHLLTHTSGMHADPGCFPNVHDEGGYWMAIETAYAAYKLNGDKEKEFDWIAAALSRGVRDLPEKQWMYCSFGFALLGAIIEKLTGMRAEKYIEENICKPLGMNDTLFHITSEQAKRYILHNEYSEERVGKLIRGEKIEDEEPWCFIPETGGGLNSSVYDVIRYGNMVLNNGSLDGVRILGRKAVEKMTALAIQKPDYCWGSGGTLRGYGLGFDHRNSGMFSFSPSTVMHEGAGACALYVDPEEELVATWIVPFVDRHNWSIKAMYNTVNIIWSGLL